MERVTYEDLVELLEEQLGYDLRDERGYVIPQTFADAALNEGFWADPDESDNVFYR